MSPTPEKEVLTSAKLIDGQKDQVTCKLCRRQFAKYTCPTCNAPYCSLTCFRSQAHDQCSESFYKKEIETEIHSGPSKSSQERKRMIELLQKFEDDSANERISLGNPDENLEDPTGLAERFAGVDLDSASESAIWAALKPEERKKFLKALEDPTSQLAQDLLASGELSKDLQSPWWEAQPLEWSPDTADDSEAHQYGTRPSMMRIPLSMIRPLPLGHPLIYNMAAICTAYAYVTRSLATSPIGSLEPDQPLHYEAKKLLRQLVSFLTERKSDILYPNISNMITGIWSSFELGHMTDALFTLLLKDAARLLRPGRISEVSKNVDTHSIDLNSHPHQAALLVLSDLHALFSKKGDSTAQATHITHKIVFYAAHIASTPTFIVDAVAQELESISHRYAS